jgi:hypothetical protein
MRRFIELPGKGDKDRRERIAFGAAAVAGADGPRAGASEWAWSACAPSRSISRSNYCRNPDRTSGLSY